MEIKEIKAIVEAMLFSTGREVTEKEFMAILELNKEQLENIMESLKFDFESQGRGIEIIKVNDAYQMCTKKEYYEYIYPLFDNRSKPNLSNPAMETLAIIAYNPKITRAEIEAIRGVNSDGTMYKLLEYNLIENVGKADAPGRPSMYSVTNEFLKMFGITSLDDLPELPRYKLDENQQIVIDDIIKENNEETEKVEELGQKEENKEKEENIEAPMPEREDDNK